MIRKYQAMWMMTLALAVAMVAGGTPVVAAQNEQNGQNGQNGQRDQASLSSQDQQFVAVAAQTNLFEVAAARAALTKHSGNKVRDYANMIIKDHTRAQRQLSQLGQKLGVKVPEKLNKKHQKKVKEMAKLRGEQFRTKFVTANVKGHHEAIKKFEHEAKQGQNKQLKAWATEVVPVLKKHLKHAKKLESGHESQKSNTSKKSSDNKEG